MKDTIRYATVIMAAAAAMACAKEPQGNTDDNGQGGKPHGDVVFTASIENTKTIVAIDGSEGKVSWEKTDGISVFDGSGNAKFVIDGEAGATVSFRAAEGQQVNEAGEYYALYPYDASASLSAGIITTSVPSAQNGLFAQNVTAAYTTDSNLKFMNVLSVVRFTLDEQYVTKVTLKGNNGEILSGNIAIAGLAKGTPSASVTSGGSGEVSVGDGTTVLATGKEYCLVILPQKFEKGFTLTLQYQDDKGTYWDNNVKKTWGVTTFDKKSDKTCEFMRSQLTDLGSQHNEIVLFDDAWSSVFGEQQVSGYDYDKTLKAEINSEDPYAGESAFFVKCGGPQNSIWWTATDTGSQWDGSFNKGTLDLSEYAKANFMLQFAMRTTIWDGAGQAWQPHAWRPASKFVIGMKAEESEKTTKEHALGEAYKSAGLATDTGNWDTDGNYKPTGDDYTLCEKWNLLNIRLCDFWLSPTSDLWANTAYIMFRTTGRGGNANECYGIRFDFDEVRIVKCPPVTE